MILTAILFLIFPSQTKAESKTNFHQQCNIWPRGWPIEHHDESCNRVVQNSVLKSEYAEKPITDSLTIQTYLNLPQEQTWACPLEESSDIPTQNSFEHKGLVIGKATKWILYNEASTPIVVERVNESPFVGYASREMKSAVYPNGPVVLPGEMAVVNGYEGQLFTAREYKEDFSLFPLNTEHSISFKSSLPRTWSFGTENTRFSNSRSGVMHVLGSPGRVLMKHRMGLIHIKNDYGALCPEEFGGASRIHLNRTIPIDLDPHCNYVSQGMLNKVGCPIDLYFQPPKINPHSTFNCEIYSNHMGSLSEFIQSGQTDVNSFESPVIHQRTYDSHSFIVRTSHDGSFVARIEVDADRVHDCPELKHSVARAEVSAGEVIMQPMGETTNSSANLHKNLVRVGLGAEVKNTTLSVSGLCSAAKCGYFQAS